MHGSYLLGNIYPDINRGLHACYKAMWLREAAEASQEWFAVRIILDSHEVLGTLEETGLYYAPDPRAIPIDDHAYVIWMTDGCQKLLNTLLKLDTALDSLVDAAKLSKPVVFP